MAKKKGNSKDVWLDWLRDEPPTADAQAELRERFKRQANSYQPVNRVRPAAPAIPPDAAALRAASQTQPVASPTTPAQPAGRPPAALKPATPATVSIQIHLPSLQSARLKRLADRLKQITKTATRVLQTARSRYREQLITNRSRTVGLSIAAPVVLLLLVVPPIFDFGQKGTQKTATGQVTGTSSGATVKYDTPPFQVVTPSTKPRLATPDGVHAAYDGTKNTYTYSDSIGGNGFTVSQQPIPPQFKDGRAAIDTIAPTLTKDVVPVDLNVLTGAAALSTNPKYNSQIVVATVRDVLIFIQSGHAFKSSEWENYLNTLQ